jgi:hypothetical protein
VALIVVGFTVALLVALVVVEALELEVELEDPFAFLVDVVEFSVAFLVDVVEFSVAVSFFWGTSRFSKLSNCSALSGAMASGTTAARYT